MARTALTTRPVTPAGLATPLTAANVDGNTLDVGDGLSLLVLNSSAGSVTVTVQTPFQVSGLDVDEVAVAVPNGAGSNVALIALDPRLFRRPSAPDAGKAYVDYSAVTNVYVMVVQR
jgi:hypothetical protein